MDSGWTPGASNRQKARAAKDPLDDLLGDLLVDDSPPKKKTAAASKQTFSAKKQSSKDEDFYSSLAQAADEDKLSDVSEADVTQMAKSIADLDDLDADLFTVGAATKTPKRGSLKEKSGKPGTPRRSGTPRSRGGTPRASSPPLRMISPANRVISPTHQRVTSPQGTGRGTPTSSTGGIDPNRAGSGSKKSSVKKPASPKTEETPEYRPTTAPGKMTDLGERQSVGLKPGQQDQERPKTVPKAKTLDFGDFDADDPLAGIPLSDDEEDLGFGAKKPIKKQLKNSSPRAAPSPSVDSKQESPRQRSFFDRPPTRSGSNKTESPEKDVDIPLSPRQPVQQVQQPSQKPAKRRSEDLVFSDDDDLIGGLGIEDKGGAAKPKAKPVNTDEDDNRPAKSVMDKLLGKDSSVSKHLDHGKERKEFILDSKYTQPAAKDTEDDFQFGSYMPSAVGAGSNSSRPTSRRSVRFQDDDDIFGINDTPSKTVAKKEEDSMDWLEMATAGRTKPLEKEPAKETKKAPETKPGTAPSKSTSAADWLGLKDDDDDDMDFLKSSSFSAPARQTQAAVKPQSATTPAEKQKPGLQQQKPQGVKAEQAAKNDDYLGLGEEVDPSRLLRTKTVSPTFGRGASNGDILREDDLFATPEAGSGKDKSAKTERAKTPTFESAARRMNMSPRMKSPSPRRSPERKSKDPSPRSLEDQLKQLQNVPVKQTDHASPFLQMSHVPQVSSQDTQVELETDLNSSTNFFDFKKKDNAPVKDQPQTQSMYPTATQSELPASLPQSTMQMTGNQPAVSMAQQQQLPDMQGTMPTGIQPNMQTSMQGNYQWQQQQQQQLLQQQAKQQQLIMKQLQRQQQQMQRQQQQQMQKLQQQMQSSMMPDMMMLNFDRPMFNDDMGFGLGGNFDVDAQAKIRRLEAELQNTRDLLLSTRSTCEEEIAAREKSFRTREQLLEETHSKKEQRWREETELLMSQHLSKVRQMEQEKSDLLSSMYKKLEESEMEKSQDIERLKSIHRQALESLKKDHDETLMRLKISKDQQIEAAASSHDTSRSLVAAVELIRNNAKDVGDLQRKIDTWHGQGLDDREITLRAKDEQLKMLQERLNKQQEDNDQERQRLQELIARLETQIREQTRMLEEERWKVKQEQSRLQGMQTALEDERRAWSEHQARERTNMEKTREALLEEQKSTLTQLHKERQALAEEQVEFNMKQKMAREEGSNYSIKTAQARAEYEALTKAIAEARDRYETIKEDVRKEQEHTQEERRMMEKERNKMEKKEAELMEAANMLQEKSQQIEDTYTEGQRKYEEGMAALQEAQRVEGEEGKRIDTINHQLNLLRVREKEISEERLRLSKEKRECEKFRNTLLCPNCRTPTRHMQNGAVITSTDAPQGLLMASTGYPNGQMAVQNGSPVGYTQQLANNPALQLSVNTVDAVTESIRSDRSIRLWKMEALKDQKYLEEQTMFLHTLKHMPYTSPKS